MNQTSYYFMNFLIKSESFILYLNSLSLRKNKIAFLKRRVSAFITLARVLTHMTSKIMRNTLFIRIHY